MENDQKIRKKMQDIANKLKDLDQRIEAVVDSVKPKIKIFKDNNCEEFLPEDLVLYDHILYIADEIKKDCRSVVFALSPATVNFADLMRLEQIDLKEYEILVSSAEVLAKELDARVKELGLNQQNTDDNKKIK